MTHAMGMRLAYSGLIYRKVDKLILVDNCLNTTDI